MTGVGHVTRRDAERVRDEMSGIGPGSSRRRDRVGTGRGTSHNMRRDWPSAPAQMAKGESSLSGLTGMGLDSAFS